ncbi:hypothetical protein [Microbacterium elymi]|uniref:Uncharacterized protein n=1 Tax=Microbacterium elymi TaxID=2909587 RepID=A0ABY5NJI8_9MICO|nr:hypothetical protein [Microbacterium elymi]UUT35318.1 hypothetical protein L2X98_34710 [Microbacterium elymi]
MAVLAPAAAGFVAAGLWLGAVGLAAMVWRARRGRIVWVIAAVSVAVAAAAASHSALAQAGA